MTTGRINQVTTQRGARGAAPRPTGGTSRTLADGRPDSLPTTTTPKIALQTLKTQTPAVAAARGRLLHAADGRCGRRPSVDEAKTKKPNAFPCGQRCNLADGIGWATADDGGQPHRHGADARSDGRGHRGYAPQRRRDVRGGLMGSPAAPRLNKRHTTVGTGAGTVVALLRRQPLTVVIRRPLRRWL